MTTSAACGGCGSRLPIVEFPVAKADPHHRATAVCNSCLRALFTDFASVLDVRPSTSEEDSGYGLSGAAGLKRKYSGKDVTARKRATQDPLPASLTCRICCEEKATQDGFIRQIARGRREKLPEVPLKCYAHLGPRAPDGPVCKACISGSVKAAIEVKAATDVGCFHCNTTWVPNYVRQHVSMETFALYSDEMLKVKLSKWPSFVWCPNATCGHGGLAYKNTRGWPQVVCGGCSQKICAECRVEWHPGVSCALAKANRRYGADELETMKRLEWIGARMCPRCHTVIEKDGGCPNMVCARCKQSFNWDRAEQVLILDPTRTIDNAAAVKHGQGMQDAGCEGECTEIK